MVRWITLVGAALMWCNATSAGDWPGWRGPLGNGISEDKGFPVHWSAADAEGKPLPVEKWQNIRWKVAVPGKGNSSPIVWKDRLFLTTTLDDEGTRAILCFRRTNGDLLWKATNPSKAREKLSGDGLKAGFASPTPITDGERVYAFFGPAGVLCVDFDGKQVWHEDLGALDHVWGTAASPVLWKDLLILNGDNDGPAFLFGLSKKTGQVIWKTKRPSGGGWSTPLVVRAGDREELVVSGAKRVTAYDPESGKELWHCQGLGDIICPTPVAGHGLIFVPTGSNGPMFAVKPGGTGDVTATHLAWQSRRGAPYVPSPILVGDYLYLVNNGGLMSCYEARMGKQLYQERLAGSFSSSFVAAGDKLYIVNEEGEGFVIAAGPEFKVLATNRLGEPCLASPALADGSIILRTDKSLFCIAEKR